MELHEEFLEGEKPRRSWRRWRKRIGWSLLILTVILVGRQAWVHYQASKHLKKTPAEMDHAESGWRLEDIEAAREQVPEEENSARVVVAAVKLLPKQWPSWEFDGSFDSFNLNPPEQLPPEQFARLTKELAAVRPALEEARKLAGMPRGHHHIAYDKRNVLATHLPDQQETRRIVTLLMYDAFRHAQNGDAKSAFTSCRAALNASRSLGDEPMIISQLIRAACISTACRAVERTLAQGEPTSDELTALQRALEVEDAHPSLLIGIRGERAMLDAAFRAVENGDVSVNELLNMRWSGLDSVDSALVGLFCMDTREDHALMLSLMARCIARVQLPMHEQIEAERQFEQDVRDLPMNAIMTRSLMPATTNLGKASRRKHALLRCMIVALATEHYRQKHKTWPDTLDKLCPDFLSAMPVDPFDGKPLRYRRFEEGVMIYSVESKQPDMDIGYRLWDVAKRCQPPKPKPRNPR